MAEELQTSIENGVMWIRLNRPEAMNAVNNEVREGLLAATREAERNPQARAVVITGSGRAFCAGADIQQLLDRRTVVPIRSDYETLLNRLRTMPKPTIAALNGVAAGIGASIALACDIRYATPGASLIEAFAKIGLTADGGASWVLPRVLGTGLAYEHMYTGDPIKAVDAERFGLYNRVVEADELEPAVRTLAERLAAGPAQALGAIKRSVIFSQLASYEEALDFEFLLQDVLLAAEDFEEGANAFLEKRAPQFKGRT